MDESVIPISVYTPFADLDLLLGEEDPDRDAAPAAPAAELSEPETIDAFNAQILAGLVSP
jgi:hypothetical protein